MRRGDVFWCDLGPPVGVRQAGRRPCIVVQSDRLNLSEGYRATMVVPFTTRGLKSGFHVEVAPDAKNALPGPSWAITNQVLLIAKRDVLQPIGRLQKSDFERVWERVLIALGDTEPYSV